MTAKRRDQPHHDLVQQYLPGLILNTIPGIIRKLGGPYVARLGWHGSVPAGTMTAANRNKAGASFQYVESLLATLAVVKSMTGLSYRHLQGMLIEAFGDRDTPCYTTTYRKFQAFEITRNVSVFTVTGGGTVRVRLAATLPASSSTTGASGSGTSG